MASCSFHRWQIVAYRLWEGEWREGEVLRANNCNGHISYVIRDMQTREVFHRMLPEDVRAVPEYEEFEAQLG